MKKIVSLLLAILCISGMLIIPAYAAAYPSISTKAYIETKAEIQIDVYKNKWRTTRGTCSPAKSYYAYIDPDDTIKILAIYTNADSALVEYPTSSGKRKGYVKLDTLFYHAPKFDFKATASANTYVRPYGAKYGSIAKGDTVYHVGESNNHVLVIYTAKSGSRAYKLAYITEADYEKITKTSPTPSSSTSISLNVPLYKQNDPTWKDIKIGNKTIGQVGCTTTCISMVYSYHKNQSITPDQMRYKLKYSNNDLYWSSLTSVGLNSTVYNRNLDNNILRDIYSKIKAGKPVIIGATTTNGSYQHWVIVTGYIGQNTSNFNANDFTVNDPGTQNATTLATFLENGARTNRTYIGRIIY